MCTPYVHLMKQIIYDSHILMLTKDGQEVSMCKLDLGDKISKSSEQSIFFITKNILLWRALEDSNLRPPA